MLNGSLPHRPILELNLATLNRRIEEAATRGSRAAGDVTVVAVTKYTTCEIASALLAAGVADLGESRIQEARKKVGEVFAPEGGALRWHLIGHLQTNKVRKALPLFHLIHSVDSLRLAREIDRVAGEVLTHPARILFQVNVSAEEAKFGFKPDGLRSVIDELVRLPNLEIQGLMTMAPFAENPEESRPHFRALARLRDELRETTSWPLPHLSMGMTQDFEVAIEEGATLIRVGSFLLRGVEA